MPFQVAGSPDDGFTSAEILDADGDCIARVFELESGWYVEAPQLEALLEEGLVETLLKARNELLHYVNRKGGSLPEDATRAAVSLWLMQRDDGKGFTVPPEEQQGI